MRASVQFNSEVKHSGTKNVETLDGGAATTTTLDMIAPGSTIIKLRSAVTDKIVVFANWRSAQWSKFVISADTHNTTLGQGDLWAPDSGIDYTIGGAMVINDKLTAIAGMARSPADPDSTTESALAPFNGTSSTFFGGTLKVANNVEITGVISNVSLGDTNVASSRGTSSFYQKYSS